MNDPTPGPTLVPAPLFTEPYVAVIFSNVRAAGDGTDGRPGHADEEGYAAMAEQMDALAREQCGYLGIESVRGADGLGITVSYWATEADAAAWKQVTDHLGAQRLGRERWYQWYVTRIAVVSRSYAWQRETG
jgi:heme-degrading monooxygenase HmoA